MLNREQLKERLGDLEERLGPPPDDGAEPEPEDLRGDRERWPGPIAAEAFHGVPGDFVSVVGPHSESDPAALLMQFLVAAGNMVGRNVYTQVEDDLHYANLFTCIVGKTAGGRKGVGWGRVRKPFAMADSTWARDCINGGLSSGEGLIWCVRDPIKKLTPIKAKGRVEGYEHVIVDEGIEDKRLCVLEAEMASVLKVLAREGNTLSSVIRKCWDTGDLATLTKNSAAKATGAHVSISGHITKEELSRYLDSTEMANGFANRFLWICSGRSKYLPRGGNLQDKDIEPIAARIKAAAAAASTERRITWDKHAGEAWDEGYRDLSDREDSLFGAVTSRAEAQTLRLSLLYAILDRSNVINIDHLKAALAVWGYAEASARYIFGDAIGDPTADRIDRELQDGYPYGLDRTAISKLFQRHVPASAIDRALDMLAKMGRASKEVDRETGGRPKEIWLSCVAK